jgi:hypothetical protein
MPSPTCPSVHIWFDVVVISDRVTMCVSAVVAVNPE